MRPEGRKRHHDQQQQRKRASTHLRQQRQAEAGGADQDQHLPAAHKHPSRPASPACHRCAPIPAVRSRLRWWWWWWEAACHTDAGGWGACAGTDVTRRFLRAAGRKAGRARQRRAHAGACARHPIVREIMLSSAKKNKKKSYPHSRLSFTHAHTPFMSDSCVIHH